jgi:alpha-1,2-mannosyltransferase
VSTEFILPDEGGRDRFSVSSASAVAVDPDRSCTRRRHGDRPWIGRPLGTARLRPLVKVETRIVSSGHVDQEDRLCRNTNGSSNVARPPRTLNQRHRLLNQLTRFSHTRWLQTILWGFGVISLAITMTRALDIGLTTHQVDFDVYLMGAKQVFTGHLYTSYLASPKEPFTYPPISALLFIPFTAVSRVTAQAIWAALSTLLLIGFLYCSLRALRPRWHRSDLALWSLILILPRLKSHSIPRGIMTGIAGALKLTPLIFVPFLFATRQIRAGCVALITFSLCGILMLIAAPSESWSYWTRYVFDAHRVGGVIYISNQSFRSTIYRFSHGHVPEGLLILLVFSIGIVGLSTAVWAYRKSSPLLGILLCAVTGLLVSPITWAHHLVWVVPIILWLALAHDRPAFGRVWAALVTAWYWYGAIWRIPHGSRVELHDTLAQMLVGNSYTLSMLLFVGGMILMLALRHHRGSDDRSVLTGLDRDTPWALDRARQFTTS